MSRLSVDRMNELYLNGSVTAAAEWLQDQDDPFGVIADMNSAGNLVLLLAHYKTDIADV
jgi:hypothetical protein